MNKEVLEKIKDYLANHEHLNLGTVTKEGKPMVHTLAYASEGATVYFMTHRESRKTKNMSNNPAVAYTVDQDDYENWTKIRGVQAMGKAKRVDEKEESERAMGMLKTKFPQMANLPPNPNMVVFKVEPTEIYYLDNSVSFGHRDQVKF
jgi:nitroimidazol reductase NimA-like FMN-containing flavoprotein (pyridoxamine 5'-phosphate oxidase superfamily)